MKRRELLAAGGAVSLAALAGCVVMPRKGEVVDGAGDVELERVTSVSTAEVRVELGISQEARTHADYVVAVHDEEQVDVFKLGTGETSVELEVPLGDSTLLFVRGGELFKRGYEQRHRGGTTVARAIINTYSQEVM